MSIRPRTLLVATTLVGFAVYGIAAPQSAGFSSTHRESAGVAQPPEESPRDFYGNEVRPAVAQYTVDSTGALYEVHSPDTEVPRLAPPEG